MNHARQLFLILIAICLISPKTANAAPYPDRFVWVFGWGLQQDSDVADITQLLENAAKHGINGAVFSAGFDSMTRQKPDYFRRLDELQKTCDRLKIELIPSMFSIGYGSALRENRMLAEGMPVRDAPFVVANGEARLVPDDSVRIANGDFEHFDKKNRFASYGFHDQPGEISFADTQIKHGGSASMRLENFTANQYGHGRVMQKIALHPHRCYRMTLWVKTESLSPANCFNIEVLAKDRNLAAREFEIPSTTDWQKITILINSGDNDSANFYAGVWGGKSGKLWLDDWSIEEIGPINVLHRPGTPVTVRSEDGAITYDEGKDYAQLEDRDFNFYHVDRKSPPLRLLPGSRIKEGQKLAVSWYHPMVVNRDQVTTCMAEPELYDIFDREAQALAEHLHPKRVLLNMDEIRMGGTCKACEGKDMAALLGECITREEQILRKHNPGVQVYVWSDMLDPNHNAHGDYYLVQGSYAGSWNHVPRDLVIAVWGGPARPKSLKFFADQGFQTLVSCYYDADNLDDVKGWVKLANTTPNARGFMYTPWQKKYELLEDFGELLHDAR